ncbi:unnamed protein product, partial [Callosobruchus maculatus]
CTLPYKTDRCRRSPRNLSRVVPTGASRRTRSTRTRQGSTLTRTIASGTCVVELPVIQFCSSPLGFPVLWEFPIPLEITLLLVFLSTLVVICRAQYEFSDFYTFSGGLDSSYRSTRDPRQNTGPVVFPPAPPDNGESSGVRNVRSHYSNKPSDITKRKE